ncbi:hypothetical protein [Bosea sp. 2RAB26]|uniref:hypothetical protein n=1 Tax=Bosea sp. 2RAB26 TaxID=3237476 RepID=UPI003F92EA94
MYLSRETTGVRLKEAAHSQENRREIGRALTLGQITKRDLLRWGYFSAGGLLMAKNGFGPFVGSAYADSLPRSPTFGAVKFQTPMQRADLQRPIPLLRLPNGDTAWQTTGGSAELPARNVSYHTDFTNSGGALFRNPVTGAGPFGGRPPGEFFAHQRWEELYPKRGYLLSLGQIAGHRTRPGTAAAEREFRVEIWGPAARAARQCHGTAHGFGEPCSVQAALWRTCRDANLQRPAGRPGHQRRLWTERELGPLPQRP